MKRTLPKLRPMKRTLPKLRPVRNGLTRMESAKLMIPLTYLMAFSCALRSDWRLSTPGFELFASTTHLLGSLEPMLTN